MKRPPFTIGIEEEYQTIDPRTYDLRSHIHTELMSQGQRQMKERVKAEMHQSVVEVGTGVCNNIKEAAVDLMDLRRQMIALTEEHGLRLVSGATHPFADWRAQDIHPDERYTQVVEDMQIVARANLIFGLHVHIGINDNELLIQLLNQIRYFLPHLLALSSNSPFWIGMNTGLKSYRCKVFDRFPRTNIPEEFTSWADFEGYVNLLVRTGCIDNGKKIWWDARPHPVFGTLEVRGGDIPMRVEETLSMAALILIARRCPNMPALAAGTLSAIWAPLAMIPFSTMAGLDGTNLLLLAGFGLVNSTLGFALFVLGSRHTSPVETALIGALETALTPVWVWIVFH